jgi:hypothetical protein
MSDGDDGLFAFQPETAGLIPVIRVRHEPGYVLVTVAGEVDYGTVAGCGSGCSRWRRPAGTWWPT